ncbi:MAG: MaoC family dehydratase [Vulcanimicrobiaceae bacterium]
MTEADVAAFAEATGDRNPVHLDAAFAATTRFGRPIAHGMLTASFISALLGGTFPGPGTIYVSQSLSFVRPVYVGDTLDVVATVTRFRPEKGILVLATEVRNEAGEPVLSGEAVCLVGAAVQRSSSIDSRQSA